MTVVWLGVLACAVVAGASLVGLMVVPMRLFFAWALATGIALAASLAGLVAVAVMRSSVDYGLLAALLASAGFAGGHLAAALFLPRIAERPTPAAPPETDGARDGTTVLLAAEAEPEAYDPVALATLLAEYDETGVPLPWKPARPLVFAAERARYRLAFSFSPARSSCRALAGRLREELGGIDVAVSWFESVPRLGHAAARAAADGAARIVVLPLAVAESRWSHGARKAVESLALEELGIRVAFAPPLWAVDAIGERLADRIVEAARDTPADAVGVALVAHGQPESWDALSPVTNEQETYFCQRIRLLLTERGIAEDDIRVAWLSWREPDVTDAVRHLGALGSARILVVPVAMPTESLGTLVDLRQAVRLARLADTVETVYLDAWGTDDVIVRALADVAREQLDRMTSDRDPAGPRRSL